MGSKDLSIVVSITTVSLCFCIYWFSAYSDRLKNSLNAKYGEDYFAHYGAFYQKGIGFFWLGVVPLAIAFLYLPFSLEQYGLGLGKWELTIYWCLFLGGALTILPFFSARKKEMMAFYPQIRVPVWSRRLLLTNALVWTLYMVAYEFVFRGFLFINLNEAMGLLPALVITASLASLTHMPKGGKETFATIPLSIVLCLIVVHTGSIWACIIIHSMLAISNDFWALRYNTEMQLAPEATSKRRKVIG